MSWELVSQVMSSSPASLPAVPDSPVGDCRHSGAPDCAETVIAAAKARMTATVMIAKMAVALLVALEAILFIL